MVIGPLNGAESGTLLTWFRYRGFPDAFLKQESPHGAFPVTRKEAQRRTAELSNQLRDYQRAYFVESRPLVSDAEYDRLFDELTAIESQFPDLALPDSPPGGSGPISPRIFPRQRTPSRC